MTFTSTVEDGGRIEGTFKLFMLPEPILGQPGGCAHGRFALTDAPDP